MSYKEYVNKITPKENKYQNTLLAFLSGGFIGLISEIIVKLTSPDMMSLVWIIVAGIVTGFGIFDDLANKFKMGLLIPTTGFANSIISSMLDYKHENVVLGIGSNTFKLAGSVILSGIIASSFLLALRWLLCLV